MSESTDTPKTETNVETVDAPKVEKDPKVIALEHDNFKQREEIRGYKEEVTKLTASLAELTEGFNTLKSTLDAQKEAEAKAAKDAALASALDTAGIVDDKAKELATKLLKDSENPEEDLKQVITDYPFLTGKTKIVLPDTGKVRETSEPVDNKQKLSVGLSKLINK